MSRLNIIDDVSSCYVIVHCAVESTLRLQCLYNTPLLFNSMTHLLLLYYRVVDPLLRLAAHLDILLTLEYLVLSASPAYLSSCFTYVTLPSLIYI